MKPLLVNRLVTPEERPKYGIFLACIASIFLICALDIADGADVRENVLYVFPLAVLALHSKDIAQVLIGSAVTCGCALFTLISYQLPLAAKIVEGFISLSSYVLIVVLARTTRENHLESLRLATLDPLTGLLNRRGFEAVADLEILRQKRYAGVFSLVCVDLAGLKILNDSQGQSAGDYAVNLVADLLRWNIGPADSAARIGADEFVILMPNTHKAECAATCAKITADIEKKMTAVGFPIAASTGCATFEQAPDSTADALHSVALAMQVAKAAAQTAG
jgi:diguanylate cyclase (GGDEF)-like protein